MCDCGYAELEIDSVKDENQNLLAGYREDILAFEEELQRMHDGMRALRQNIETEI